MKFLLGLFLGCFLVISAATAYNIKMFGQGKYGFSQPNYTEDNKVDIRNILNISAIADADNFPFSSSEQGSVFNKIFSDLAEHTGINISFVYNSQNYPEVVLNFERNKTMDINAHFGVYYKEIPYSHNEYVYPAFFDNNIHIIFLAQNKPNIENKEQLREYKGVYAKKDKMAENVLKDIQEIGAKEVETLPDAYKELLTGGTDYILASYYPSLIEAYKLGIKKNIIISKNPLWKMPMFIRVKPQIKRHKYMEKFERYLRSSEYKNKRDRAFEELIEIYKENTKGIVPPTYTKTEKTENNEQSTDEK